MAKFPDVRLAVEADRADILGLCRMLHDENGMFPLRIEAVEDVIDRWLRRDFRDPAIIGVVGSQGSLSGVICIAIHTLWYTTEPCCDELFNFVHPAHRKSNYAQQQIEFAKTCAEVFEMPLMIGVLSSYRTAAKVRLYQRLLPKAGEYFVYSPQNGQPEEIKQKRRKSQRRRGSGRFRRSMQDDRDIKGLST